MADRSAQVLLQRSSASPVTVGGQDVVLMGVINRSPESANKDVYADGPAAAVEIAERFATNGVAVIDVGGQSTNYENPRISTAEELDRLLPTVEALADRGFAVSVDTFRPEVVAAAADAGASLINATDGLADDAMVDAVAQSSLPAIVMHLEAADPLAVGGYDDAPDKPERVAASLEERLAKLAAAGINDVIVDPGTGISYRSDYDRFSQSQFELAEHLEPLARLEVPVLYAVPRKADRHRNVALAALAMASGASMLRIHDVEMISDVAWLMRRLPDKPKDAT